MTRAVTGDFQAQLDSGLIRPVFLVELEFRTTTLHLWTGRGTLKWQGLDWLGIGRNGGFSNVDENGELRASGVTFTLGGIDATAGAYPQIMQLADRYTRQGGIAKLYLALLDSSFALVRDPWLLFSGLTDVAVIEDGPETAKILISAETRLSRQSQRQGGRYTDEDQKLRFPGDRGFEYMAELQDRTL